MIAIGSDGMMEAVGARAAWRAGAASQARTHGDRLDQLADAVHDEGDLRAVPAAPRRSGDRRARRVVFSCFNQDQELDRVDFACLRAAARQNGVQEKLTRAVDRPLVAAAGPAASGGVACLAAAAL